MDTEQPEQNKSVCSIVSDFNKSAERKSQRRENTLISFAIKAIARDQEKHILISRLQRELAKAQGMLNLVELENDMNVQLVKEKEEEIESLKHEIEALKNATVKSARHASINLESVAGETPTKRYNFNDDLVISTQGNVVASPSALNHDLVSSSKVEPALQKPDSSKAKTKIVKKKSIRKPKAETHVTSFLYNLRNRTKSKANLKNEL